MTSSTSRELEIFRCEGVSKHFAHTQVLSDIGFSVYAGEILGIIGPNGAGKTTLMECLTGLLPCDTHALFWRQQPILPRLTKEFLYYLPDGIQPYPDQIVETVLRFFQRLYAADIAQYNVLISRLELRPILRKVIHSLSKGYRRRLLLAIGLLSRQPLLMLDEPFDGFDLRQTLGVMNLLRETLADRTLLLSIHQLSEAEKICDRFLLLSEGRVAAIGSLKQLREQTGLHGGGLEEVFLAIV
ncbi:MAG TPA: ABC transporter ATP-binding protein [Gammaproteobacteria bacterium]|nr:ABC transporter ATP-binding protein [Gammaproteobacteria bacterium]